MSDQISKEIKSLLIKAGVTGEIELTAPPNPEMGDLSFACFGLAKKQQKNPVEVAEVVKSKVESKKSKVIERVETMGPYVNFTLNTSAVAKMVMKEIDQKDFGIIKKNKPEKVMIEYSQPNTHKEFHVGHLRNVAIGATLVELYRATGFKVIAANYIGDIGAHVAKCLWGMKKFHQKEKIPANRAKWLGQIYAEASRQADEILEAKAEIADIQRKLESGDLYWTKLWEKTRAWSLAGFDQIYQELGVKFDQVFFESEVEKEGKKIVTELLKSRIAKVGEGGAIIVDLTPYSLDTFLILKSDGSSLYATKDLALAKRKFQKFKIDQSLYVVDARQSFYFKQLFKTLELLGFKRPMNHIIYEFVKLPEGTMSSRTGNVVLYEDLHNEIYALLKKETENRHGDWSKKKIEQNALILTLAVLKFTMQKHETGKVIVFDIKEAASFEGFSAPYVLYVVARINSLLRKGETQPSLKLRRARGVNGKEKIDFKLIKEPEEKRLLMLMGEYMAMVEKARIDGNPSVVTRYCFDLAQAFNDYYNKHKILTAENIGLIKARLALCADVKKVLEKALGLLTIETAKEM